VTRCVKERKKEYKVPSAPIPLRVAFIGPSGVGKSCLIRTLFEHTKEENDHIAEAKKILEEGNSTIKVQAYDPFYLRINSEQVILLSLIDTVGYGDDAHLEENWEVIMEDFSRRNQQGEGYAVDVVIYILEPCRIKGADVEFMKLLGENFVLIPVIGKADSMDPKQRDDWKGKLYTILKSEREIDFFSLSDKPEILGVCGSENGAVRTYGFHDKIDIFDVRVSDMDKFKERLYDQYHIIRKRKKEFLKTWKTSVHWSKFLGPKKAIVKHRGALFTVAYHLVLILIAFFVGQMFGNIIQLV